MHTSTKGNFCVKGKETGSDQAFFPFSVLTVCEQIIYSFCLSLVFSGRFVLTIFFLPSFSHGIMSHN